MGESQEIERTGEAYNGLPATRAPFVQTLEALAEAMPMEATFPEDLTFEDFGRVLAALKTTYKKTAIFWGRAFDEARRRFGDDAYQLFTSADYSEATLQNYARLTQQLDPELWYSELPDRHLFAVAQNVQSPGEQKRWVEHAKSTGIPADQLRSEIHAEAEAKVARITGQSKDKAEQTVWVQCPRCGGAGGWPEDQEGNQ